MIDQLGTDLRENRLKTQRLGARRALPTGSKQMAPPFGRQINDFIGAMNNILISAREKTRKKSAAASQFQNGGAILI